MWCKRSFNRKQRDEPKKNARAQTCERRNDRETATAKTP